MRAGRLELSALVLGSILPSVRSFSVAELTIAYGTTACFKYAQTRRSIATASMAVGQAPVGFVWGESFGFDKAGRAIPMANIVEAPLSSPVPAEPPATSNGLDMEELTILRRIGKGTQGEIRLGESEGVKVAIKIGLRPGAISREAEVLSVMSGVPGFPELLHFEPEGLDTPGGALVLGLLGPSLDDLHQMQQEASQAGPTPSLSGTAFLRVGGEILCLLRALHQHGFVHNDVKPTNLLLGSPRLGQDGIGPGLDAESVCDVHLIDFGSCTRAPGCLNAGGNATVGQGPQTRGPIGSLLFASVAADECNFTDECLVTDFHPTHPVDDLESLVYTLVFLTSGCLPWHGLPAELMQKTKREMLTSSSDMAANAALTDNVDCQTATAALRALYAEVRRCRRERYSGSDSAAVVDYDACLAALGAG